jgi:hypothetical protein
MSSNDLSLMLLELENLLMLLGPLYCGTELINPDENVLPSSSSSASSAPSLLASFSSIHHSNATLACFELTKLASVAPDDKLDSLASSERSRCSQRVVSKRVRWADSLPSRYLGSKRTLSQRRSFLPPLWEVHARTSWPTPTPTSHLPLLVSQPLISRAHGRTVGARGGALSPGSWSVNPKEGGRTDKEGRPSRAPKVAGTSSTASYSDPIRCRLCDPSVSPTCALEFRFSGSAESASRLSLVLGSEPESKRFWLMLFLPNKISSSSLEA